MGSRARRPAAESLPHGQHPRAHVLVGRQRSATVAPRRALERATIAQIRGRLVAAGLATDAEIEQHLTNLATGLLDAATSPMITAWGRKP
jgi:hypothetical protein